MPVSELHDQRAALSEPGGAALVFSAEGIEQTAPLRAGERLRVRYAPTRLEDCRGTVEGGRPAWSLTGYASLNGGPAERFLLAGHSPDGRPPTPEFTLTLPEAGELQLWFEVSNRWGCVAWDSVGGANHRFEVLAARPTPDWMGDVRLNIDRAGGGCDAAAAWPSGGFTFDSWARSRATETAVCFEVWEPGLTDRPNPALWQALDVRVYHRYSADAPFAAQYVNFEAYRGNNARYRLELRGFDPFEPHRSGCPTVPWRRSADGQTATASFEFYFQVNGVTLRPAGQPAFVGRFEAAAAPYARCVAAP